MVNGKHQTPLDRLLVERGITGRALAAAVGTGETQVSRWRRGLAVGTAYRRKIIRKLRLTEAEIAKLGWDEEAARV